MKKDNILNVIILVTFIVIAIFVGAHHEPWADEAQAWLIARDASVSDIILNLERYEGTPPLWHLILKCLIKLGYQYEYLYLISIFFVSLGFGIVLFKLKLPISIKILLPFTYFFLYEYTIKARNYCLILPTLAMVAVIYEERNDKPYIYNFWLGVLASISLHTALISGILFLFEIIEIGKDMLLDKKKFKDSYKNIIACILLIFLYLFIIFCCMPASDAYVAITITNLKLDKNLPLRLIKLVIKMLEAFTVNRADKDMKLYIIGLIYFLLLNYLIIRKNKKKILFLSIFISEVLFILFIRATDHHVGLILYTFLFALYLVRDGISVSSKKLLIIMLCVMFIIQIFWSILTIIPEIEYNFCAAKDVAAYLKTLDYKNMKIYSSGYYSTAILPYFDENIFYNDRGGATYYKWSSNNLDWVMSTEEEEFLYTNENDEIPDIIILHDNETSYSYELLIEKIKKMGIYTETHFDGNTLYKGIKDLVDESHYEGYYVFERIK
jgi:hypothetical protein